MGCFDIDDAYLFTRKGDLLMKDYGDDDYAGEFYTLDRVMCGHVLTKLQTVHGLDATLGTPHPTLYSLFGVEIDGGPRMAYYDATDTHIHDVMAAAVRCGIVMQDVSTVDLFPYWFYCRTWSARVLQHFIEALRAADVPPADVKDILVSLLEGRRPAPTTFD